MSRVIKFRAQNEIDKCFVSAMTLNGIPICLGKIISGAITDYELNQFTGLHDKNGVEIYEGDVVQDHIGVGVVEWHSAAFKVNYRDGWAKWFYDYTLKGEFESIEVVGNIYQNPELLK